MKNKNIFIPIVIIVLVAIVLGIFVFVKKSENSFSKNLFTEISYDVPLKFERDEEYAYSRYYRYTDNFVHCSFSVNVDEKDYYNGFNNWFKGRIHFNLNDEISELKEITVNDIKMLYIEKKSRGSLDYYYGVESSKYFYLLTYSIDDYENGDRNDLDSNFCYNVKDNIIDSVNVR